eukprot:3855451-Amphidinium_carterae.2
MPAMPHGLASTAILAAIRTAGPQCCREKGARLSDSGTLAKKASRQFSACLTRLVCTSFRHSSRDVFVPAATESEVQTEELLPLQRPACRPS